MVVICDNLKAVEDREQGDEESAIPVISHTTTIVALACEVGQSLQREVFILVQEHLGGGGDGTWKS